MHSSNISMSKKKKRDERDGATHAAHDLGFSFAIKDMIETNNKI